MEGVLFTVEAIKGSPLNQRVQERARQCGVFIILMLMLFAFGNDLHRLVTGP
jgi:regulator of sigma E protease